MSSSEFQFWPLQSWMNGSSYVPPRWLARLELAVSEAAVAAAAPVAADAEVALIALCAYHAVAVVVRVRTERHQWGLPRPRRVPFLLYKIALGQKHVNKSTHGYLLQWTSSVFSWSCPSTRRSCSYLWLWIPLPSVLVYWWKVWTWLCSPCRWSRVCRSRSDRDTPCTRGPGPRCRRRIARREKLFPENVGAAPSRRCRTRPFSWTFPDTKRRSWKANRAVLI